MHRNLLTVAALAALLSGPPAAAHHSGAAFDQQRTIRITGTVTEIEWTSPHARLYVRPDDAEDETVVWNFELPSPNTLMRRGWRRDSVRAGDDVTVTGSPARDRAHIASAKTVTDEDGNSVFSGSAR